MECNINEVLKFQINEDGFPKLTEKNVKLINFIINNDSNYRSDNDEENVKSTLNLVKQFKNEQSKENLEKIIKAVDKQNSTHLSVSGNKKGKGLKENKEGIEKTTDYIFNIIGVTELKNKIEKGDCSLVDDIAVNAINNRYIISFASKFCTYISRYMFNNDKFSIYDGVMAKILPYYYFKYSNNHEIIKINNRIIQQKGYKWYHDIIKTIIKGASKEITDISGEKYEITRKDLDHLLWYYYKGDKDIKDDDKKICYKSRITRALENIK